MIALHDVTTFLLGALGFTVTSAWCHRRSLFAERCVASLLHLLEKRDGMGGRKGKGIMMLM